MAGFASYVDQNVRLTILKALSEQVNVTLNDSLILAVLETFGHVKTKEYVRNQLSWLETEVGAVRLVTAGSAVIATLTQPGLDHVQRRRVLEGVQRPSLEG